MCLQHALMWLFRIQPKQRQVLMQRCIPKCNSLGKYVIVDKSGIAWNLRFILGFVNAVGKMG